MLDLHQSLSTRYPRLFRDHARAARTLTRFLGLLFHESRFQQFGREYPHLEGFDFVDAVLRHFDFTLRLRDDERARIPASGRVVIAANHPIGSLDGLALLNLVRQVRPDVKVVANDLLTTITPLHPVLLPINNMGGTTPRQNLRNIREHLEQDGALIIFPAGEVSRLSPTGIKDSVWQGGFVKIARATASPILPVYVAGRNSIFFYSLSFIARPLSTLWLVREMFKQAHHAVDTRIGNPVPPAHYDAMGFSAQKLASLFRKHVYRIAKNKAPIFRSIETVAAPENRLLLKRELAAAEHLGATPDGKQIVLAKMADAPCVMRELGRLRELTFRSVGEGTGLPRDIDRFDRDYLQLVLWDPAELEIAGAYRLADAAQLIRRGGLDALYTHSLFEFGEGMHPYLEQGLELGRSFVQPRYQTRHSLDYLWWGIGAFVTRYPRFRYLFGPASISRSYGTEAIARIAHYYGTHFASHPLEVTPRNPFIPAPELAPRFATEFASGDRERDFQVLRDQLAREGLPVPTLYKHYAQATEPDGVTFTAFNIDPEFGDCVDSFVLADLSRLTPRKRKRYLAARSTDCRDSDN